MAHFNFLTSGDIAKVKLKVYLYFLAPDEAGNFCYSYIMTMFVYLYS